MLRWLSAFGVLFGIAAGGSVVQAADGEKLEFGRDVRNILSNNCFKCHGPDVKQLQAGLRLDRLDGATLKLESGKTAIVPGKSEASDGADQSCLPIRPPIMG